MSMQRPYCDAVLDHGRRLLDPTDISTTIAGLLAMSSDTAAHGVLSCEEIHAILMFWQRYPDDPVDQHCRPGLARRCAQQIQAWRKCHADFAYTEALMAAQDLYKEYGPPGPILDWQDRDLSATDNDILPYLTSKPLNHKPSTALKSKESQMEEIAKDVDFVLSNSNWPMEELIDHLEDKYSIAEAACILALRPTQIRDYKQAATHLTALQKAGHVEKLHQHYERGLPSSYQIVFQREVGRGKLNWIEFTPFYHSTALADLAMLVRYKSQSANLNMSCLKLRRSL